MFAIAVTEARFIGISAFDFFTDSNAKGNVSNCCSMSLRESKGGGKSGMIDEAIVATMRGDRASCKSGTRQSGAA